MPVTRKVQLTPNSADVRVQVHVALTFALSLPIVSEPPPFQLPTRHSMSETAFGSGSAAAVMGTATERAAMTLMNGFMRVLLSHLLGVTNRGTPFHPVER